jgi:hypothetical protein
MMKSSDLQSFVPKDNVGLNLGKMTIYVYPHISKEMSNNEKGMQFENDWLNPGPFSTTTLKDTNVKNMEAIEINGES